MAEMTDVRYYDPDPGLDKMAIEATRETVEEFDASQKEQLLICLYRLSDKPMQPSLKDSIAEIEDDDLRDALEDVRELLVRWGSSYQNMKRKMRVVKNATEILENIAEEDYK